MLSVLKWIIFFKNGIGFGKCYQNFKINFQHEIENILKNTLESQLIPCRLREKVKLFWKKIEQTIKIFLDLSAEKNNWINKVQHLRKALLWFEFLLL